MGRAQHVIMPHSNIHRAGTNLIQYYTILPNQGIVRLFQQHRLADSGGFGILPLLYRLQEGLQRHMLTRVNCYQYVERTKERERVCRQGLEEMFGQCFWLCACIIPVEAMFDFE
jgi:hypothetical protein